MNNIYLIRHGESTANVDENVYFNLFDHVIPLTDNGILQAQSVGKELANKLKNEKINVFYSPYKRTEQTWLEIKNKIEGCTQLMSIEESPLLREQEHKFFKDMMDSKEKKLEQSQFGIFWYRFKNAESIADVHQRVSIFINSMMLRQLSQQLEENIVIVAHDITIKVILMILLKKPIADLTNVSIRNCEIIHLKSDDKLNFKLLNS